MTAEQFQKKHKTRSEKEAALRKMSNKEIDELIKTCPSIFGKLFCSKFKKPERC